MYMICILSQSEEEHFLGTHQVRTFVFIHIDTDREDSAVTPLDENVISIRGEEGKI